jgi:hypothetical protein
MPDRVERPAAANLEDMTKRGGSKVPESEMLLLYRVQELIDAGQLPVVAALSVRGGYGRDKTCAVCDAPITYDQGAYAVDDPHNAAAQLMFHIDCSKTWQHECAIRLA